MVDEVREGRERQLKPSNERRISVGGIVGCGDGLMELQWSRQLFGMRTSDAAFPLWATPRHVARVVCSRSMQQLKNLAETLKNITDERTGQLKIESQIQHNAATDKNAIRLHDSRSRGNDTAMMICELTCMISLRP